MNYTYGDTNHDHAVTQMGSDSYTYDNNGNQVTRNVGGSSYTLSYDAENRLVGVSGAASATFYYDGDGNRIKATVGGTTTTYIGNYFEWVSSTSNMIKYYYAGATRVAMRKGSTLYYLLGDHLGSTSITTDSNGLNPKEIRYYPWGNTRYTSGTTQTTFKFTGQRFESTIGLYFYNARWYDSYLNRWIQPDSIIPEPNDSQSFDRYAYALNNPVRYTDPSGYFTEDEIKEILGFDKDDPWEKVLELFEKGGKYQGRWGWLDILSTAEIGDQITIDWANDLLPEDHPPINGKFQFEFNAQGELILTGNNFYFDSELAGLYGKNYSLTHFETNNGKRVAAAFLVIAADVTIGIPGFLGIISGNPVLMKAGEFLETAVVLPVNILAYKMWTDADKENFVVLIVQAIPNQDQ